jgi:antirestriction protein ArdC
MSNDSTRPRSESERKNLWQTIADRLLAQIAAGVNPHAAAWDGSKCPASPRPRNAISGDRYHGINELLLGAHPDPRWATWRQAQARGWIIRAGEHGMPCLYFEKKLIENKVRQSDSEPDKVMVPIARAYTVFNVSQMLTKDGQPIPPWVAPTLAEAPWQAPDAIEKIIAGAKAEGLKFLEQGDRAFYAPSRHTVVLPPRFSFVDEARWSEVVLHEIGHSTAGKLGREFGKKFADRQYQVEEWVAEVTSANVCSELNLNRGDLSHAASYLDSWGALLRKDPKLILTICARANEASEAVLQYHPDYKLAAETEAQSKAARVANGVTVSATSEAVAASKRRPAVEGDFKVYCLEGIDRGNKEAVKAEFPPNTLYWNKAAATWQVRADDPSVIAVVSKFGTQAARDELAGSIDGEAARKQADAMMTPTATGAPPPTVVPRPIIATAVAAHGPMPAHIARRLNPQPAAEAGPPPPSPAVEEVPTWTYAPR